MSLGGVGYCHGLQLWAVQRWINELRASYIYFDSQCSIVSESPNLLRDAWLVRWKQAVATALSSKTALAKPHVLNLQKRKHMGWSFKLTKIKNTSLTLWLISNRVIGNRGRVSFHPSENALTAGENQLIHEQVGGAGLGLGKAKPLASKLVLLHLLFHTSLLGNARCEAGALLGDSPVDGLFKSATEKTMTGSSFLLLSVKEGTKTWKGDEMCEFCGPGSLWMFWSRARMDGLGRLLAGHFLLYLF